MCYHTVFVFSADSTFMLLSSTSKATRRLREALRFAQAEALKEQIKVETNLVQQKISDLETELARLSIDREGWLSRGTKTGRAYIRPTSALREVEYYRLSQRIKWKSEEEKHRFRDQDSPTGLIKVLESIDKAAVLFIDVKDFSMLVASDIHSYSIKINQIFERFKKIIEKPKYADYGLRLVKADANCMIVCSTDSRVPVKQRCVQLTKAALKMATSVDPSDEVTFRFGLHCGHVHRIQFGGKEDFIGAAMNIAARMDTSSIDNQVHLSEAMRKLVVDDIECSEASEQSIKSLGTINTYWALGYRSETPSRMNTPSYSMASPDGLRAATSEATTSMPGLSRARTRSIEDCLDMLTRTASSPHANTRRELANTKHYESTPIDACACLVTDMIDSTRLTKKLGEAHIELLDDIFTSMANISQKYGLVAIKSVGDCLVFACYEDALKPEQRVKRCAQAATEMAIYVSQRWHVEAMKHTFSLREPIRFRFGVGVGPVHLMPSIDGHYDLIGPGIRRAFKMEKTGMGNMVQVDSRCGPMLDAAGFDVSEIPHQDESTYMISSAPLVLSKAPVRANKLRL